MAIKKKEKDYSMWYSYAADPIENMCFSINRIAMVRFRNMGIDCYKLSKTERLLYDDYCRFLYDVECAKQNGKGIETVRQFLEPEEDYQKRRQENNQ